VGFLGQRQKFEKLQFFNESPKIKKNNSMDFKYPYLLPLYGCLFLRKPDLSIKILKRLAEYWKCIIFGDRRL
jgi:hypothetical protein